MHEIIVFGDIEMGGGTVTDDFISDKTLAAVINKFAKKKNVDLVLNGDTFDFLKCPDSEGKYPVRITEKVSLEKLSRMVKAHKLVIEAIKNFAKNKNVYFVFGNHDLDLTFPKVQKKLKHLLGKRIHFGICYKRFNIHVEHGQQHDWLNKTEKFFSKEAGERVLSLSLSSRAVLSSFIYLKEEDPFLERIHSRSDMFVIYPPILQKLKWQALKYLASQIFNMLWTSFRTTVDLLRRWRTSNWELPNIVMIVKKELKASFCVLGHVHNKHIDLSNKTVITPDTWRDEYMLVSKKLFPKKKHFVDLHVKNNKLQDWKIVHVPIKRSVWKFKEVVKDQRKYIEAAAKEEGCKLPY